MDSFIKSFRFEVYWIYQALLTIFNIGFIFLPLTNTLGYEFAALNSVLLFLVGGFFFLHIIKRSVSVELKFFDSLQNNKLTLTSFLMIPLAIGIISTIIIVKCPFVNGMLFYFIVTIPGFLFGIIFGLLSFFINRKFSHLIFLMIFLLIALMSLSELYFYPEVSFYNLIIGYFPGTIYDEDLKVDNLLIAYRLFNFSFMIIIIFLIQQNYSKGLRRKIAVVIFLLFTTCCFYLVKPYIKLATSNSQLEKVLHKSLATKNFVLHFSDSTKSMDEIFYAGLVHEYFLDQNKILLDDSYKSIIDSYIFYDRAEKRELIGVGNANLAKPWLNQVYLNNSSYEKTIKHELVHVLASKYGTTPFKIASGFNSAILEGCAMAIEDNFDGYPVHYMAKLASNAGYKVKIRTLFDGMNFFLQTSSVSYVYTGSFIKYLIENYGIEKVKHLYTNLDFEKCFNKDLSQLSDDYDSFLQKYPLPSMRNKAQVYFGGQTIFKKFCSRIAAADNKNAGKLLSEGDTEGALKLYRKIYNYSNMVNALIGIEQCLSKQKKYNEAAKYLKVEITKFQKSQFYYYLELMLGDLLSESDKPNEAVIYYDSISVQNPHIDYLNNINIRLAFLNEGIDSLKSYLSGKSKTKLSMLLRLNEKEVKYFSVPIIIDLAGIEQLDLSRYFEKIKGKIILGDYSTSNSLMEISRYFLKKFDYDNAQFFAVKAVNQNLSSDENHCFVENLRMVNWFKNFGEETRKSFRYADGL